MPCATAPRARNLPFVQRPGRRAGLAAALGCATLLLPLVAGATIQRPITQDDSGKTFRIPRGHERTIQLSHRYRWSEPVVAGRAIRLVRINYILDPGFDAWVVHARARGIAWIRAAGADATCESSPCPLRRFRLRIVVTRPL